MTTGQKMSTRPVVQAVDGTELVLCLTNGNNYLVPLGLLANLSGNPELTKQGLGLEKVDNTSDEDKPLSIAAQEALATKVDAQELAAALEEIRQQYQESFAPISHGHLIEDVQGLSAELDRRMTVETAAVMIAEGRIGLAVEESVAERLAEKADRSELQGILTALTGKASLSEVEAAIANLVTEQQLEAALNSKASSEDLQRIEQDLQTKASDAELQELRQVVESVPTQETIDQKVADAIANSGHVTAETVDLKVNEAIANSGHVTAETLDDAVQQAIQGLATQEELTQGLATKVDHETLEQYATVASVDALNVAVAEKMSAAEVQNAISGLATQAEVAQQVSDAVSTKASILDLEALQQNVNTQLESKVSGSELELALQTKADKDVVAQVIQDLSEKADVSQIPDVSAFVDMSQVAQAVQQSLDSTQSFVRVDETPVSRILWVCGKEVPGANGSINRPYETIQQAIDSIPGTATGYVILVMPRQTGNYAGFVVNGKLNMLIQGFGCNGAHAIVVNGTVTLSGANTTRARLKDFQIKAPLNGQGLVVDGTQGRHYLQNVTIEPASGTIAPTVVFKGGYKNWTSFDDCAVGGDVHIEADVDPSASVYFNGNNAATNVYLDGPGKLIVRQAIQFGYVEQNAGSIDLRHISSFEGKSGKAVKIADPELQHFMMFCGFRSNAGQNLTVEGAKPENIQMSFGAGLPQ